MSPTCKEVLSVAAIALTFAAYLPYLRSIVSRATRPHVFSWIIWGSTTLIVFLAQLKARGGAGAWPLGVSTVISFLVAGLAYRQKSDTTITRSDWAFFLGAMSSLPFWLWTSDPLWAVVILTVVDVLGFGPTMRKAWMQPFMTHVPFFTCMTVRNVMAIVALERYSSTTVLFPAVTGAGCLMLVLLTVHRRQVLRRDGSGTP